MLKRRIILGALCIFAMLLTITSALGAGTLPVHISEASINGEYVEQENSTIVLESGDYATVKIEFWSKQDLEDVTIEAFLAGHSSTPVERRTATITMDEVEDSTIYTRRLAVNIPSDISPGDYTIVLQFFDDEESYMEEYEVEVKRPTHGIEVRDISVTPESAIKGGRTLGVRVGTYNFGSYSESVRVTGTISGLDLKESSGPYTVPRFETVYSDTLYFSLPTCAPSGRYTMKGVVEYGQGLKRDVFSHTFTVNDNPDCDLLSPEEQQDDDGERIIIGRTFDRTIIEVPPPQSAQQGGGEAIYNIKITNEGRTKKSYYLDIEGIEWAWSSISPSNLVVLDSGKTVEISIGLRAKDDAEVGTHPFTVDVKSGTDLLEQITLVANVVSNSDQGYEGSMGGVTANVIKRSPGQGVDIKAIGEVGLTLLVTLAIIGVTVFYFLRLEDNSQKAPKRDVNYYDNIYSKQASTRPQQRS